MLVLGTLIVAAGLVMILRRELGGAAERRKVGPVRDTVAVWLPVVATIALVAWVWAA